jgi:recombination protein RecT
VFIEREEVEHNLRGNNKALWEKYFNDFFKKHMVKRAAKGQFGIDISEDEGGMSASPSVDNIESYERKDITAEAQESPVQPPKASTNTNTPSKQENATQTATDSLEDYKELLSQKFAEIGLNTNEDRVAFIQQNLPDLKGKLNVTQIKGLIKVIDMELEQRNSLPEELE